MDKTTGGGLMKLINSLCLTVALCLSFSLSASAQIAVKKGSFTTNNGTPPFDQAVTGVGLGVAGEAIIFFWTDQTAEGTTADQIAGFGAATSSSARWAAVIANDDNVATTDNSRDSATDRCILGINPVGGAVTFDADFKSFDGSDGNFTVTWQTNPGAGRIIHFLVLGGTDLTNSNVILLDLNSSTGNQSYAHGLGTTPNFGFFVTVNTTGVALSASATLAVGWAVSTTKRGSISINADDAVTMTTAMDWNQIIANDRALVCLTNGASTLDIELDFVSWDGTNITFNQINAPLAGTNLYALFLAGGQYDAGTFDMCTTTNCTDSPTTVFQPKGAFLAMPSRDQANRTVEIDSGFGFGAGTATDGTQEGAVFSGGLDATLNTVTDQSTTTTKVIRNVNISSDATLDEADLTAFASTSFSIQWTTNAGATIPLIWWAIGDAAAAPTVKPRRRIIITSLEPREYEVAEAR